MKTLTIVLAFCIAFTLAFAPSCAWWNRKGKGATEGALVCAGVAMASQVGTIIGQIQAGNWAVLSTIGADVLECAIQQLTSATAMSTSQFRVLVALRAEKVRRLEAPPRKPSGKN